MTEDYQPEGRSTDGGDESKVHYHRRSTDPENAILRLHSRVSDCETSIEKLIVGQAELSHEFKTVSENIKSIADILNAWNNARGFLSTLDFVAGFLKVGMVIGASFLMIWIFLKTGVWTVPDGE